MEEKINNIIDDCFTKLREVFEEEGLDLDYETQEYVEELINKQLEIERKNKEAK